MSQYVTSIINACIFFPFIAFLFTLPYILYEYHKYGSIPILRVIIVYSFILYLNISYFLVILPLPTIESVALLKTPRVQLIPFSFVKDIITHTSFVWNDSSTYIKALTDHCLYQVIYNIFLFIPLGIYLRYYFKCNLKKVVYYSFMLSLFFELTQLSGLYFIYPRGYRLFDIDDLMINTLGGLLGYYITPIFSSFLPTRKELEISSYKKGMKVSILKVMTAFFIDFFILTILTSILYFFVTTIKNNIIHNVIKYISPLIIFVFIPLLNSGKTIGKNFVHLQLITFKNKKPNILQYIFRYILIIVEFILVPILIGLFIIYLCKMFVDERKIIVIISIMFALLTILLVLIRNIILKKPFLFEIISRTKNKSTIEIPDNLKEEDK